MESLFRTELKNLEGPRSTMSRKRNGYIDMGSGSVLSTMAEVSVGLTGISGIIALIRSHTIAAWDPMDLLRLGIVVAFGLGGVLFALLPLILIASGVTTEQTWGICSLALALFMIGLIAVFLPRSKLPEKTSVSTIPRSGAHSDCLSQRTP